jgi:hypothetical protein
MEVFLWRVGLARAALAVYAPAPRCQCRLPPGVRSFVPRHQRRLLLAAHAPALRRRRLPSAVCSFAT